MIGYIEMFSQAPNNGLEGTIKFWGYDNLKEIVYGTFVYLSYFILDGCQGLFIAVVTFLTYFFLFRGIYLMDNENKKPNYIWFPSISTKLLCKSSRNFKRCCSKSRSTRKLYFMD